MKNNIKLLFIFFILLFLMNMPFLSRPFFQEMGGCLQNSFFSCLISLSFYKYVLGYTIFDFVLYSIAFYMIGIITMILTRSVTTNKYYKHMIIFLLVKAVYFSILFLRQIMPVNFIYVYLLSFPVIYLIETKLAYNGLMIGEGRGRSYLTLIPSMGFGCIKLIFYYLIYPVGLFMLTEYLRGVGV